MGDQDQNQKIKNHPDTEANKFEGTPGHPQHDGLRVGQRFLPKDYQLEFPSQKYILNGAKPLGEEVPLDVLFVGAGPGGLAGAIRLAQNLRDAKAAGRNVPELQIGVVEKAGTLGGHCLSGAVMNPIALRELFPELKDSDFPFKADVEEEAVYFLTENSKFRLPTPPTMHNKGNKAVSLCEVVRWLGSKAEELGINVFTGFPAEALLMEDNQVVGVRTVPTGQGRDGQPGSGYMAPTDIKAKVTVLSEGTKGHLTQAYLQAFTIESPRPQIWALGVKELWRVKKPLDKVIHTLGWPLAEDSFGGSWMYPMGPDLVSFGLVVGLDYRAHNVDVHGLLQKLKNHPLFAEVLEGGEISEWGAKTIPEGGVLSWPKELTGDGLMILGDAAGFVNVPALKGIHYAMKSGILAADVIFQAALKEDFSHATLRIYSQHVKDSYIYKDLYEVRNMRQAFKSGFFAGGVQAGLMTVTKGLFPGILGPQHADAEEWKEVTAKIETQSMSASEPGPSHRIPELSKVDAVYLSGNKTRDDIPSHLTVGENIEPEVADMYVHMCPAGVYERQGDKLVVNAPNCVDCKATDVIGPRWQPREGGSGPDYKMM